MPTDNLTARVRQELERRGKIVSDSQIEQILKDNEITTSSRNVGIPFSAGPISTRDKKEVRGDNVLDLVGSMLWHGFDTAAFGLPGIALGEEAPYQWEEMGSFGNVGAVLGEAAGFLAPLGVIGKLTGKGVAAATKYGTKAAKTRAVDAAKLFAKPEDAVRTGEAVEKAFSTKAFKRTIPSYEISTAQIEAARIQMGGLIRGGLKKEFPKAGDDIIEGITNSALEGLAKEGVHVNKIGKWVERSLNTKFSIADKSKITAYIGKVAEMTSSFSLYNLIDDGIKSMAVEGHEFDPVGDVGSAFMFSAFLPAVEMIPYGGKMKIFKTRKDVKKGLNKIKTMDYDKLEVSEINALFKIVSNNNKLKHSTFAVEAAKRFGNAFKDTPADKAEAVKHLKALFSNFNPSKVYAELRKEIGLDLVKSIPRMTIGAAYFNSSTLLDENMLRNVDPEILGAHLLVGALFTRRYKPLFPEQFPTLKDFDRKVEFLKVLGFDGEQIKYLGEAYGLRGDLGAAYTGLLSHPVMSQISEAINTGEHKLQSKEGVGGVGELQSEPHSLIQRVQNLYVLAENSRKVGKEDADVNPDVRLKHLTDRQLTKLDAKLRKIKLPDGEFLNESNFHKFRESVFKDISEGTYEGNMKTLLNIAKEIGLQTDYKDGDPLDMTKSIGFASIRGLSRTDGNDNYTSIREFQKLRNRMEALGFIHEIRQTAEQSLIASHINAKEKGVFAREQLDNLVNKIREDNYNLEEGTVVTIDPTENQFLNALGNYKREHSLNTLYNFVEGRIENLSKSDAAVYNEILNVLPEGTKIGKITISDDMTQKDWNKLKTDGDYFEVEEGIKSLSEMMNISSRGESRSVDIEYEDAKTVMSVLRRGGFKVDVDMARTFESHYYKNLLSSMEIGSKHIAIIEQGLTFKAFRLEQRNGKRVLVVPDKKAVERMLSKEMGKEELIQEMERYDAIMSDMRAINGSFMRVETEMPLSESSSGDMHSFIYETYGITSRFDKNIVGDYRKVRDAGIDRVETLASVKEVLEKIIDYTDPNREEAKKLTLEEVSDVISSLRSVQRTSGDNMSGELSLLVDQLVKKMSLKNVGEDGMMAVHGDQVLALERALTPEFDRINYVNEVVSKIIFGLDNYVGDRIHAKKRMDFLVARMTKQLRKAGIEVTDGENLSQLSTKYFNSGLSIKEKIDKRINITLDDFANELNRHIDAWASSISDVEYYENVHRYEKQLSDSSLKDKDTDIFAKSSKTVSKLSDYNEFFSAKEFAPFKEMMKLYIAEGDISSTSKLIDAIISEADRTYGEIHKDSPKSAKEEMRAFKHSVIKELLFGVAGTHTVRSVKLKYAGMKDGKPRYLLTESKMVAADNGASKIIRKFEKAGVYVAMAESEGIILDAFGKPTSVSNIFAEKDINTRFFNDADLTQTRESAKEREEKGLLAPEGSKSIRIPISFSTQLIVEKRGYSKAKGVLKQWYNSKIAKLEKAVKDNQISKDVVDNFKTLYSSVLKEGEFTDSELKQFVRAMYWDNMNSSSFNKLMESPVTGSEVNPILASMFKYLSVSEGVGTKVIGSDTALKAIKEANKSGEYKGELLTSEQSKSIDYYLDKDKLEVLSINDSKMFDSFGIVERQLKELAKNSNLKADANNTLGIAKTLMESLRNKSGLDGATYVGTHMWNLSLLQKGREGNDGSGGIKQSISYNDGVNTMLLKQNFTYDPNIAAVIDALGVDILTFDSSAKVYAKKQLEPNKQWEGESLPIFFSRTIGTDAKALRDNGNIQDIKMENIMFVKSEDRHNVTNITYSLSEYLDKAGYTQYIKDYANYDGILSSGNEMLSGIVSRGGQRLGISSFVLNALAESGNLVNGSTNLFVKMMVLAGVDPKSSLISDNVNRVIYRHIINRVRKPQTDGGSYSTMIPFLEGSPPVYNKSRVQVRFGGKKLAHADGSIKVQNFDKLQYIVDVGGREVLIGKNTRGKWEVTGEEKLNMSTSEKKILNEKKLLLNKLPKRFSKGVTLSVLYEHLKNEGISLDSLSLRMPNLAADVAIHKIEGFYSPEMGNVVGINVMDLATKHQGDFDADMAFNYHDTKFEITNAVAGLVPRRMDAYVYDYTDYDFKDIFANGNELRPVGSLSDPIDPMDLHIENYNAGKNNFGQIKRLSAGINSLNRINMMMDNLPMLELKGENMNAFLQRLATTLQSLIDTTQRPNFTNKSTANELKRFILFGDEPSRFDIKLEDYNESSSYSGIFDLPKVENNTTREIYKDSIIEIIDTLGRPSRVMSDLFDGSGRRVPDQNDLINMRREIGFLGSNVSQYIFNKLVRRYRGDKRDALLKMFYDFPEGTTTDALRKRILENNFGKDVQVEKYPFSFNKSQLGEMYDSTPAGYVLNRIGNVKMSYERTAARYGASTKSLARNLDNIENFIALSNAKTHEEIMEALEEGDFENGISIALTGGIFNTKISDIKYAERYSTAYFLLGRNASGIRQSLRRNGKSNDGTRVFLTEKLHRINAIMEHMRNKEDGLIGEMIKGESDKNILNRFDLREINITKKAKYIPNMENNRVYLYKESRTKGKWEQVGEIAPKSRKRLYPGRYVVLKNPIRFEAMNTSDVIDSYAMLSVVGDIQVNDIRGFKGGESQETSFIADSRILKSQISALSQQAYRMSEGHPEGSENWSLEKEAEDMLVDAFMKRNVPEARMDVNVLSESELNTIHDVIGYMIKPEPVFGNVTYIQDRNFALPSFKMNKRMSNAMLRWLINNGHDLIFQDIMKAYGTNFRRRYDNIPDLQYSAMFSSGIHRSRNVSHEGKSEVYNMIADTNPDFLYTPAISEILKNEMSYRSAKVADVKDINGDLYKIMRFGKYEDINVGLDVFLDPKSTKNDSNLDCY